MDHCRTTDIRAPYGYTPATRPYGVVLGTDDIASAIAVFLHRAGWRVAMAHDADAPVLKRGMAFYDTAFGDPTEVDGIKGQHGATSAEIRNILDAGGAVTVTPLAVNDLIVIGRVDALVDARQHRNEAKPDLRWLAGTSIGIGKGWRKGTNCDRAIALPPEEIGSRRILSAPSDGYWHSPIEPGMRIYRDFAVGQAGGISLRAPCDGLVLGALRDGLRIRTGMPLIDIDPSPRRTAQWNGLTKRSIAVAKTTLVALGAHQSSPAEVP